MIFGVKKFCVTRLKLCLGIYMFVEILWNRTMITIAH